MPSQPQNPALGMALQTNVSASSAPAFDPFSDPELAAWLPLDKTLGAFLLGTFLGLILYGTNLNQLYKYYRLFPSDKPFIRILVAITMTLETFHATLTMYTSYFVLVSHYSDLSVMASHGPWALNIQPFVTSATMFFSQLFFARRVFSIGPQYRVIAGVAMMLFVAESGFTIATTYRAFALTENVGTSTDGWLLPLSLGMPLLADTLLTSALTSVLRRTRSGLKRNDTVADLAVVYIVNTGLLHCIFNAVSFSLTIGRTNRSSFVYEVFTVISTRLYAISFLSVLNSREALIKNGMEVLNESGSYGLNLIARVNRQATAETWNVPQVPESEPTKIHIDVRTERAEGWDVDNLNVHQPNLRQLNADRK